MAQTKGTFETHDFDNFRLHVYHTNDALGDAKLHRRGNAGGRHAGTAVVPRKRRRILTPYLDTLGKPSKRASPTTMWAGTGDHATVMPAGMPAFTKDAVYDG